MSNVNNATSARVPAVSVEFRKNGEECAITAEPDTMRILFADGQARSVTIADLNRSSLMNAFLWHGVKQKFIDAAAISRSPETGRSATVGDKRAAVEAVIDMTLAGEWSRRREAGDGPQTGGLFFVAICRLFPHREKEALRTILERKSKEELAAMKKSKKVMEMMAQVKAERNTVTPEEEEELFAGLDGMDGMDEGDVGDAPIPPAPDFVAATLEREEAAQAAPKARKAKKGN